MSPFRSERNTPKRQKICIILEKLGKSAAGMPRGRGELAVFVDIHAKDHGFRLPGEFDGHIFTINYEYIRPAGKAPQILSPFRSFLPVPAVGQAPPVGRGPGVFVIRSIFKLFLNSRIIHPRSYAKVLYVSSLSPV
jgi:hypothetical protein